MAQYLGRTKKRRSFGGFTLILQIPVIALSILLAFWLNDYRKAYFNTGEDSPPHVLLASQIKSQQKTISEVRSTKEFQIELIKKLIQTGVRTVDNDSLHWAVNQLLAQESFHPTVNISDAFENEMNEMSIGLMKLSSVTAIYLRNEESDRQLIEIQIEPYLVKEKVISLLEPYQNSAAINISEQQTSRIIRQLLNDRSFIDLVYLRIHRLNITLESLSQIDSLLNIQATLINKEAKKLGSN
ncbi:hypothetical protein ACV07N_13710 [Roseivirga echinicomitans]